MFNQTCYLGRYVGAVLLAISGVASAAMAQDDPLRHFATQASAFNNKGYERSSGERLANANELINTMNGNLKVTYGLFSMPLRADSVNITLTYNGSVDYLSRTNELTYQSPPAPVTSCGWILGVNGWGVQALNYETKLFTEWSEDHTTSDDGDVHSFIMPGYEASNPQRENFGFGGNGPTFLLRGDGGKMTLYRGEPAHNPPALGQENGMKLLPGHPGSKTKAWIGPAPQGSHQFFKDVYQRTLTIYQEDGTIATFEEHVPSWSNGVDPVPLSVLDPDDRIPVTMLPQHLTLTTGERVFFEHEMLQHGRAELSRVFIPSAGVYYRIDMGRTDVAEMSVSEWTCSYEWDGDTPVVTPGSDTKQREWKFGVDDAPNKLPRRVITSITDPAGYVTEFEYEDHDHYVSAMRWKCVWEVGEECGQYGNGPDEHMTIPSRRIKTIKYAEGGLSTYVYESPSVNPGLQGGQHRGQNANLLNQRYIYNVSASRPLSETYTNVIRHASRAFRLMGREPNATNMVKRRSVYIPQGESVHLVMTEDYDYTGKAHGGGSFTHNHRNNELFTKITVTPGSLDPTPKRIVEHKFGQRAYDQYFTAAGEPFVEDDATWDYVLEATRNYDDNLDGIVQDQVTFHEYKPRSLERIRTTTGFTTPDTRGTWHFEPTVKEVVALEYGYASAEEDPDQLSYSHVDRHYKWRDLGDGEEQFELTQTTQFHTGYLKLPGVQTAADEPYRVGLTTSSEINAARLLPRRQSRIETVYDERPSARWRLAPIESIVYNNDDTRITTTSWRGPGQINRITSPVGAVVDYVYEDTSFIGRYATPTGVETQAETFTSDGRFPTSVIHRNGAKTSLHLRKQHNYRGQVTKTADANRIMSEVSYYTDGRARHIHGPGDYISAGVPATPGASWEYPSPNEALLKTYVNETEFIVTKSVFDGLGRESSTYEIDTHGSSTLVSSKLHNYANAVVKATDADGVWSESRLDSWGRMVKQISPGHTHSDREEVSFAYDHFQTPNLRLGNPIWEPTLYKKTTVTDQIGRQVASFEDSSGNVWQTEQLDASAKTDFSYDLQGRRGASQTPEGWITRYAYDDIGQLTWTKRPEWGRSDLSGVYNQVVTQDTLIDPTHGAEPVIRLGRGSTRLECGDKPTGIHCSEPPFDDFGYFEYIDSPRNDVAWFIFDATALPDSAEYEVESATLELYVVERSGDIEIQGHGYTEDWVEGQMWEHEPDIVVSHSGWSVVYAEQGEWIQFGIDRLIKTMHELGDNTPGIKLMVRSSGGEPQPVALDVSSRVSISKPKLNVTLRNRNPSNSPFDTSVARTWYDEGGRAVFGQMPHNADSSEGLHYTYTKYDDFGRQLETGALAYAGTDPFQAPATAYKPMYSFEYDDTSTNGVGKLHRSWAHDGTWEEVLAYDPQGNISTRSVSIHVNDVILDDKTFVYGYDKLGRLTKMKYPDAPPDSHDTIYYGYDSRGRLQTVGGGTIDRVIDEDLYASYTHTAASRLDRTELGKLGDQRMGSSVASFDYRYRADGRLYEVNDPLSVDPTAMFHQHLDWSPEGNIIGSTIEVVGIDNSTIHQQKWESFEYDDLNRLTAASGFLDGKAISSEYGYDLDGNILYLHRYKGDSVQELSPYSYDDLNRLRSITVHETGEFVSEEP